MNIATTAGQGEPDAPTLDVFNDEVDLSAVPFMHKPPLELLGGAGVDFVLSNLFPATLINRAELIFSETLTNSSWTLSDAAMLLTHLGRERFHVSPDRQFSRAYWTRICAKCRAASPENIVKQPGCPDDNCGVQNKRTVPINKLGHYEYIRLTGPRYAAVIAADVDIPGSPGGRIENLNPVVLDILNKMHSHRGPRTSPSWIGINPVSGKAQMIWMIHPVYSDNDPHKPNRPVKLLKRVQDGFNALLGGDRAFSHGFMRNPFYSDPNPNAYHWNAYSSNVYHLKDLERMLQTLGALPETPHTTKPAKPAKTGTELINQAKANRERAQQMRALSSELEGLSVEELEKIDPTYIEGVKVLYDAAGTPQRDETAFRHALKTAHRLHKRGQRLKDNLIIDAYEHAYRIAHERDTKGRANEMPPMRDRLTMARRVRTYVTTGKTAASSPRGLTSTQRVTPVERNVLRTFGSRGGKKAAQRWKDETATEYQDAARAPLQKANQRRRAQGGTTKALVALFVNQQYAETGTYPTVQEIMDEVGKSRRTVQNALKAAGIALPAHRPKKGAMP